MKHLIFILGLLLLGQNSSWATQESQEESVLHVYNWASSLPQAIIEAFEHETGIRVVYDVFDSSEMLEAKMLAARSGFDVVFPSAFPDLFRQIPAGCYRQLDKSQIPNLKFLNPVLMKRLRAVDPQHQFSIPYTWGTTGFSYHEELVKECMPQAPVDSWAMLFDEKIVSKLTLCGITLLDSPMEVFPAVLIYLGLDPNTQNPADWDKATVLLEKIAPYIRKFDSFQFIDNIANKGQCVAQAWSCYGNQAARIGKANQNPVRYVIPKEGGLLWIDTMTIPKDAPHPKNAHKFINFILRPDIMAAITNKIFIANSVPSSKPLIDPSIRNDKGIYPPLKILNKLKVDGKKLDKRQLKAYQRQITRRWMKIKTGI